MMAMTLSRAAGILGAESIDGGVDFNGLSTDTRKMPSGSLFVALQGENFDGHDFLQQASDCGAAAAAVSRPVEAPLPVLRVKDTRLALGQLAAHWRSGFSLPLVGVTGSNGKTTVKEMVASILSRRGETLVTRGNLNTDIGLPLTLSRLGAEHRYAVIEMGANHPGEIAYLTQVARPTIALVTNAGPAHLEGFGDLRGVARAKGEIFSGLDEEGVAVINADDAFADLWRDLAGPRRIIDFGLCDRAAVRAQWRGEVTGSRLHLYTPQGEIELRLGLPGQHNVVNALAACAASLAAGASLEDIRTGLESLDPVRGRLNIYHPADGVTVIDDTYNANPNSLQAALDVLAMTGGEKWLVLGDMGELGPRARQLHQQVAAQAEGAGVSRVYGLGELARETVRAFGKEAQWYESMDDMLHGLQSDLGAGVSVLVKGSRLMKMERAVFALCGRSGEGDH